MHIQNLSILRSLFVLTLFFYASCAHKVKNKQTEVQSADSSGLSGKYNLSKIKLPAGYRIDIYAEVPNARSMAVSPNGTLFVGNRNEDNVYAVIDENKDGHGDKVYKVASGLNTPNGVAFKDGNLFIATVSKILRLDNIEANLSKPPEPVVVYDKYPTDGHHGWKFIAFGPDGKLYVPVGAPCNICKSDNPIYASITRMNADGSGLEVFANGIRNSVGFDWNPQTKNIWFTENGRDNLGDDVPGDELNTAPSPGMHFGYPFCHQGDIPDPEYRKGKDCSSFTPPVRVLDAHVAALGMRFYSGEMFSAHYKGQIFIAEHGSWNRSVAVGYRVTVVNTADSINPTYNIFAEGWLQPDGKVLGRPVDVLVMPDGALLISDDYANVIYRVSKTVTH